MTQISLKEYLIKLLIKNKTYTILTFLVAIASGLCILLYQSYIKNIIDAATNNNQSVYIFISMYIVFKFGYHLMHVARHILDCIYKSVMISKLTESIYKIAINHSMGWFDSHLSGDISDKINSFQQSVTQLYNDFFRLCASLAVILLQLILLYNLHIKIFIVHLCFVTLYMPIIFFITKYKIYIQQFYEHSSQKATGVINDSISNIFGIKIIGNAMKEFTLKLLPTLEYRQKWDRKTRIISAKFYTLDSTILTILTGVQIFNIVKLFQSGEITIGTATLGMTLLMTVQWEIFSIIDVIMMSASPNIGKLKSSYNFINKPYDVVDKSGAIELQNTKGEIEFKNVKFKYHKDGNSVIDDLSLKINSGEKIGIVGMSGAGKSTIIKALLRYFDINSGEITMDGLNIKNITQESLHSSISIIPQDIGMFHRSIAENLQIAKHNATQADIENACKKAMIHDDIMQMTHQYDTIVGERGVKLSGGQRQRIAIARAILKNSPILILDEATSSLDSQTEADIHNAMKILIQDKQKTVISIAHRLSTLKNMDKIIVVDNGKIVQEGTHDELFRNTDSIYFQLWNIQRGI